MSFDVLFGAPSSPATPPAPAVPVRPDCLESVDDVAFFAGCGTHPRDAHRPVITRPSFLPAGRVPTARLPRGVDPAVLVEIVRIKREYRAMQAQHKGAAIARVVNAVGAVFDPPLPSS